MNSKQTKRAITANDLVEEMGRRRGEWIQLYKKQGCGTVTITLRVDTGVDYCYRPGCMPEPFYLSGSMRGLPQVANESAVLNQALAEDGI